MRLRRSPPFSRGPSSTTRAPPFGAKKKLRSVSLAGSPCGRRRSAANIVASTTRISRSAKDMPMQRRAPPPKGIHA